jgi:hypothetical protein
MFSNNLHTFPLHSRFSLTFEAIRINCDQVVTGATKSHWGEEFELWYIKEEESHMIKKWGLTKVDIYSFIKYTYKNIFYLKPNRTLCLNF